MITQRAVIVATIGFCLYFIAFVNALPSYFYVLTWLSVSILICSAGLALLSVEGLNCRWHVAQKASSEELDEEPSAPGREEPLEVGPVIEIEIENRGTLNKTGTYIDVCLLHAGRGEESTHRFLVEALPANTALTTGLTLTGLQRGCYHVRFLTVVGTDVLGFFRARRRVVFRANEEAGPSPGFFRGLASRFRRSNRKAPAEGALEPELLVGPATVQSGSRATEGSSVAVGSETSAPDLVGRSDEMRGTRPYVAGDDLRTVHWKSTARLGRLVVREFDRLARPECVVIWDGSVAWGDEMVLYALYDSTSPVEFGLSLSASLLRAMTDARRPCALLRLDSRPLWVPSQHRRSNASGNYLNAQEALTVADAGRATALPAALAPFTKELAESSEVFLISAAPPDELKEALAALRRLSLKVETGYFDNSEWPETRGIGYSHNAKGRRGRRSTAALSRLARRIARENGRPRQPRTEVAGVRVVPLSAPAGRHEALSSGLRQAVGRLLDRRARSRGASSHVGRSGEGVVATQARIAVAVEER